jgi:DNA primase
LNIAQLKQEIIDNPHYIEAILEALELFKIRDYGKEYRCAKYQDGSPTGICVQKDTLRYFYRGRDGENNGDIITLVQDNKKVNFAEAVELICKFTGLNQEQFNNKEEVISLPFGGYFKGLKPNNIDSYEELPTYPESILDSFDMIPNERFAKDGINIKIQRDFKVGYDYETDRIVVAWRNPSGKIIGVMGRYNGDDYNERGLAKWLPIIKFPKSQVLFGFFENYSGIQKSKTIVLGESEKFVMQLKSMEKPILNYETGEILCYDGYNFGLAVGNHSVSNVQKRLIQSCFPDTIIIAFDEGIEEDYLRDTAKKLQYENSFFQTKVGYIYDKDGLYLPKGSKASPSDFGKDVFDKLVMECTKFI